MTDDDGLIAEAIEFDLKKIPDLREIQKQADRLHIARAKMHGAAAVFQISNGLHLYAHHSLIYTLEELSEVIPNAHEMYFKDIFPLLEARGSVWGKEQSLM